MSTRRNDVSGSSGGVATRELGYDDRVWLAILLTVLAEAPAESPAADPFEAYMTAPFAAADGFASPRGGGTRIDAIAAGRVAAVADTSITVEHLYYENNQRLTIRATHRDLERVLVATGDLVTRGQALGHLARTGKRRDLHLELEPPTEPAAFIRGHAALFVPHTEVTLVLVDTVSHRMRIIIDGQRSGEDLQIGLGQAAGCKERHRDLKTPCGMYFVTGKSTGPFSGDYADYYGGHFIKLNYPNAFDAKRGSSAGLISGATARAVAGAWKKRALPPQGTRLGGGIGFHGWAEEWDDSDAARGSWGCVFLHNRDIAAAYERIPIGAMVVIL